nr:MAG TPA: tail assembly chaperone protein [Caudoviricetes sp.]
MERTITVDGKTITLRATALVPRLYRHLIGRDMIQDMATLRKAYAAAEKAKKAGADEEEQNVASMSVMNLEIFEDVAWVMLKHAAEFRDTENGRVLMNGDMVVGKSPDEWLDQLDGTFSVYEVLPVILELWGANQETTSTPAKK